MRLTVLGKSPSWQDAGGACSGYLLEDADTTAMLECGNGAFAKLRLFRDYLTVDAVVISHLHADHFLDLIPYAYGLTYSPRQEPAPAATGHASDSRKRPRLHAPPGAREVFRRVVGAWGDEELIESAFELTEYDPSEVLEVGSLRLRFAEVPHFTTTFAYEVNSINGPGRLTYGADSGPAEELVELAHGTDLLIAEATLERPEQSESRGHMTAAEAAAIAQRAGAGRLLLSHISDELDAETAVEQGAAAYGGPLEVAREGAVYDL